MEHLPKRTGQAKSVFPAILYLYQDKYDDGPFLDYPQKLSLPNLENDGNFRLNPTLSSASQLFLAAVPPAELEPFLQNWLFFGEYLETSIALGHPEDTPKILLWYDILCCPGVSREAQSMALRQMYRSYDEASIILVLDRSSTSHRVGGVTVDEVCLRIAASR